MIRIVLLAATLSLHACMQEDLVKSTHVNNAEMKVKQPESMAAPAKYIESTVINFDFDSYKIGDEQKKRLDRILNKLKSTDTNYLIKVTGYTDNKGTQKYNEDLASKRSIIIKDYLEKNKVPAQYMALDAKGKCCYLNDNASDYDRYQNRRAEITYLNEFFVVDYETNNLAKIMETLSHHHLNKKFIVFQNTNFEETQSNLVKKTTNALKRNFLEVDSTQKASFLYEDKQIIVAIAGSHPVLMDELQEEEMYGNAPQEIIKHNGKYVMRDKKKRLKPVFRSKEEVDRVLAISAKSKDKELTAVIVLKENKESDLIRKNLGFHIDSKILRDIDENI